MHPAAIDSERIRQAQLQLTALQRQQQTFSAAIDGMLAETAQQPLEQSKVLWVALGVAVALLLLALGLLLRSKQSQHRQGVVPG